MLLKVKFLSLGNNLAAFMREHKARFYLTVFIAGVFVFGLYYALLEGFLFLNSLGGLGVLILNRLFYIIFCILFFMVALSCGILFFHISFRSRQTGFYLTLFAKVIDDFQIINS